MFFVELPDVLLVEFALEFSADEDLFISGFSGLLKTKFFFIFFSSSLILKLRKKETTV
jgi:hypothetical protein